MITRISLIGLGLLLVPPALQNGKVKVEHVTITNGSGTTKPGAAEPGARAIGTNTAARLTGTGNVTALVGPMALFSKSAAIRGLEFQSIAPTALKITWQDLQDAYPRSTVEVYRSVLPDTGFRPVAFETERGAATGAAEPGILYHYRIRMVAEQGGRGPWSATLPAYATSHRAGGDVNGDGCTDGEDLVEVAYRAGRRMRADDPAWLPSADVTGDRLINARDLGVVLAEFGSVHQ